MKQYFSQSKPETACDTRFRPKRHKLDTTTIPTKEEVMLTFLRMSGLVYYILEVPHLNTLIGDGPIVLNAIK